MWQGILTLLRGPEKDNNLLTEFEDSLILIVDPEQLTNNLLSRLKELINVEKAFVYLADRSESSRTFSLVDKRGQGEGQGSCAESLQELYRLKYKGVIVIDFEHDTPALQEDMARNIAFIEKQAMQLLT